MVLGSRMAQEVGITDKVICYTAARHPTARHSRRSGDVIVGGPQGSLPTTPTADKDQRDDAVEIPLRV